MKSLSTNDVKALKEVKALIQSFEGLSPEVQLYLYDNVYLPANNLLAIYGFAKHDTGELS